MWNSNTNHLIPSPILVWGTMDIPKSNSLLFCLFVFLRERCLLMASPFPIQFIKLLTLENICGCPHELQSMCLVRPDDRGVWERFARGAYVQVATYPFGEMVSPSASRSSTLQNGTLESLSLPPLLRMNFLFPNHFPPSPPPFMFCFFNKRTRCCPRSWGRL